MKISIKNINAPKEEVQAFVEEIAIGNLTWKRLVDTFILFNCTNQNWTDCMNFMTTLQKRNFVVIVVKMEMLEENNEEE